MTGRDEVITKLGLIEMSEKERQAKLAELGITERQLKFIAETIRSTDGKIFIPPDPISSLQPRFEIIDFAQLIESESHNYVSVNITQRIPSIQADKLHLTRVIRILQSFVRDQIKMSIEFREDTFLWLVKYIGKAAQNLFETPSAKYFWDYLGEVIKIHQGTMTSTSLKNGLEILIILPRSQSG